MSDLPTDLNTTTIRPISGNGSTQSLQAVQHELEKQKKIRAAATRLVTADYTTDGARSRAMSEADMATETIILLEKRLEALKRLQQPELENSRNRSNTVSTSVSDSYYLSSDFSDNDVSNHLNSMRSDQDISSPTWLLSDILQSLGDKDKDPQYLVTRSNDLVILLQQNEYLKEDLVLNSISHRIQSLILNPTSEVVACGFRILRHIINDLESLKYLKSLDLDILLTISLTKDPKYSCEREQALKLLRLFIDLPGGLDELSVGSVISLVQIAENPDDPLKFIAVETILEITLLNPQLSYKANSFKCLLQCLLDTSLPLSSLCLVAIVKMLELPMTRQFLIDECFIQSLVSFFMEAHIKTDRLQCVSFILTKLLKTWTGIIAFSQNNFTMLKQLINCLTSDSTNVKNVLIHVFFDIFRIRPLPWIQRLNSLSDDIFTINDAVLITHPVKLGSALRSSPETEISFINHYTAMLLYICIECGLPNKLMEIRETVKDKKLSRKIIILISEVSYLRSNLLQHDLSKDIAPSFELNSLMEKELRKHHRSPGALKNSINKISLEYKSKALYNIDDLEFKNMINNSFVLVTKDYHNWNWTIITELLQGPLRSPKRFEEVIKTTKLFKRLMSFYRPFKYRFSVARKNKNNKLFVKVGCEVFKALLSHSEGVKYLSENKLMPQMAECLAQIDPYSGITASDPLFSKQKLEATLSYGYFHFLGVLSDDVNGQRILEQWWIFDMLYHISDRKTNREDVVKIIVKQMTYNSPGHLRIILNKIACTSSTTLRLFATETIGTLLEIEECEEFAVESLVNQLGDPAIQVCNKAVDLLTKYAIGESRITRLIECKPPLEILGNAGVSLLLRIMSTESGFSYLQEINYVETEMERWVEIKNKLYVLEVESLILKELANRHPKASNTTTNHTTNENNSSSNNNNNNSLVFSQFGDTMGSRNNNIIDFSIIKGNKNTIPEHFFGSLVKTVEGLSYLESDSTFTSFVEIIEEYHTLVQAGLTFSSSGLDLTQEEIDDKVLEIKATLWVLGNIGSSEYGITLLELSGVIEKIIFLCSNAPNWSIKGTCFYIMGLLSQTEQGSEVLDSCGWVTTAPILKGPLLICLPKELGSFFKIKEIESPLNLEDDSSIPLFDKIIYEDFIPFLQNQKTVVHPSMNSTLPGIIGSNSLVSTTYSQDYLLVKEVYDNLILLLVNASKAHSNLNKIKLRFPHIFESEPAVLKIIFAVLERYRFKAGARKYLLLELINVNKIMEVLFKRNRKLQKENQLSLNIPMETDQQLQSQPQFNQENGDISDHFSNLNDLTNIVITDKPQEREKANGTNTETENSVASTIPRSNFGSSRRKPPPL